MTTSTAVGTAIDYLLEELPAVMSPVQVTEGYPGDDTENELVLIGGATMDQERPRSGRTREESATLDVFLQVRNEGGTATEVRRRVIELSDRIGEFLSADMERISLGGMCGRSLWVPVSLIPQLGAAARIAILECNLRLENVRLP